MQLTNIFKAITLIYCLLLTACSNPFIKKPSNSLVKHNVVSKLTVNPGSGIYSLSEYEKPYNLTDFSTNIDKRVPIFLLSGGINTLESAYGQIICDNINNDLTNTEYLAILQNQISLEDAKIYLRKDNLIQDPTANFTADFLITRVDYLVQKQQYNSGPLASLPTLDNVMFLNGSYLYIWGDNTLRCLELYNFTKEFNKINPKKTLKIAVLNPLASELLTKLILANNWPVEFELIDIYKDNNSYASKNQNKRKSKKQTTFYNIIVYAGSHIPVEIENYIQQNVSNNFVPLSLSKDLIVNTKKANNEISSVNVADYYSYNSLANIVKTIDLIDKEKVKKSSEAIENKKNAKFEKGEKVKLPPFVEVEKFAPDYDKKVFGKSKFNFNIKDLEETLNGNKVVINEKLDINTIGIRNVLVACRTTESQKVFDIVSIFLAKHNFMKDNYPTQDMINFTTSDLIIGDLYNNNLIYHYAIINFDKYMKKVSSSANNDEEKLIKIIAKGLTEKNSPPFYGPSEPNIVQMNIITQTHYQKSLIDKQVKILDDLNSIIDRIQKEIASLADDYNFSVENQDIKINIDINPLNDNLDIDQVFPEIVFNSPNINNLQNFSHENIFLLPVVPDNIDNSFFNFVQNLDLN